VLGLALLSLAAPAIAQREIILQVRSPHVVLDERLAAELSTLGLPVEEVDPEDPHTPIEEIARARGARAAVRFVSRESAIELWVESRTGGEPSVHRMVSVDPRRGWNLAAVSALEILRADLIDVTPDRAPAPPPAPPRKETSEPRPAVPLAVPPLLWAHLGAGAELSTGGLGPSADLLGELRLELSPSFDVAALGTFSPAAVQLTGAEGVASARHAMAGVVADVRARLGVATMSAGAGGVLVFFWVKGDAPASGYAGQMATTVTAGPLARACASLDVTTAFRVRLEIAAGVSVPQTVIRFAGRQVADWGQPFGLLTLGLEYGAL
jgi:hypothetical protein